MRRLVLVGGGHAHLFVLEKLAAMRPAGVEVILITPSRWQYYSGMLPGSMEGHYDFAECRIDLRPLVALVGAKLIEQSVIGIDANRRRVCLADGQHLEYDFVSLDVGSETNDSWLTNCGNRLLPVKPLANFQQSWRELVRSGQKEKKLHICVVGGGAAGVEIALAARYVLQQLDHTSNITLITGGGLLPCFNAGVRRRVSRALLNAGVEVIEQQAVGTTEGLMLSGGEQLDADIVVAASGARAPIWLKMSGLSLDDNGFIQVDAFHRSISHKNVFAAGDVCARIDVLMSRSGVHAVHAGPILAHNLISKINGGRLKNYQPRKYSLYLLACGRRHAIASWGPFSTEGAWVWHLKDWIDRRFIKRFLCEYPQEAAL